MPAHWSPWDRNEKAGCQVWLLYCQPQGFRSQPTSPTLYSQTASGRNTVPAFRELEPDSMLGPPQLSLQPQPLLCAHVSSISQKHLQMATQGLLGHLHIPEIATVKRGRRGEYTDSRNDCRVCYKLSKIWGPQYLGFLKRLLDMWLEKGGPFSKWCWDNSVSTW